MTELTLSPRGEDLRRAMRRWVTGVSIVTAAHEGKRHGMTVNSFVSVSLDPPLVTVTLANTTRTHKLVSASGRFGVTILDIHQQNLSDRFAGRIPEDGDRFHDVQIFSLSGEIPLLSDGLAALECRVVHRYEMPHSTLFIGEVEQVWIREDGEPLVYVNRAYRCLKEC